MGMREESKMTQRMDGLTDMGQAKAGAGLKEKLKFYIEEVQFEMPVWLPVRNRQMDLRKYGAPGCCRDWN